MHTKNIFHCTKHSPAKKEEHTTIIIYPALDINKTINEVEEGGNIGVLFLLVGKIAVHLVGGVVMLARLAKGHTSADYCSGT